MKLMISSEVKRLSAVLEKFLRTVVPGETNHGPAVCSLDDILKNACQRTEASLYEKKGQLKLSSRTTGVIVNGEYEQLSQAFTSIIQNAVDALPAGGEVVIETKKDMSTVEVRICDNGSGIPPEDMNRIFDFYFSTKERGMGFGLPFAKLAIEQHDGTITVESELQKGTCFLVTLPCRDGAHHE